MICFYMEIVLLRRASGAFCGSCIEPPSHSSQVFIFLTYLQNIFEISSTYLQQIFLNIHCHPAPISSFSGFQIFNVSPTYLQNIFDNVSYILQRIFDISLTYLQKNPAPSHSSQVFISPMYLQRSPSHPRCFSHFSSNHLHSYSTS